jgi:hypothetical protein
MSVRGDKQGELTKKANQLRVTLLGFLQKGLQGCFLVVLKSYWYITVVDYILIYLGVVGSSHSFCNVHFEVWIWIHPRSRFREWPYY